jgi:DNA-binding transcriptional regulator YhcF (GntR family)
MSKSRKNKSRHSQSTPVKPIISNNGELTMNNSIETNINSNNNTSLEGETAMNATTTNSHNGEIQMDRNIQNQPEVITMDDTQAQDTIISNEKIDVYAGDDIDYKSSIDIVDHDTVIISSEYFTRVLDINKALILAKSFALIGEMLEPILTAKDHTAFAGIHRIRAWKIVAAETPDEREVICKGFLGEGFELTNEQRQILEELDTTFLRSRNPDMKIEEKHYMDLDLNTPEGKATAFRLSLEENATNVSDDDIRLAHRRLLNGFNTKGGRGNTGDDLPVIKTLSDITKLNPKTITRALSDVTETGSDKCPIKIKSAPEKLIKITQGAKNKIESFIEKFKKEIPELGQEGSTVAVNLTESMSIIEGVIKQFDSIISAIERDKKSKAKAQKEHEEYGAPRTKHAEC